MESTIKLGDLCTVRGGDWSLRVIGIGRDRIIVGSCSPSLFFYNDVASAVSHADDSFELSEDLFGCRSFTWYSKTNVYVLECEKPSEVTPISGDTRTIWDCCLDPFLLLDL